MRVSRTSKMFCSHLLVFPVCFVPGMNLDALAQLEPGAVRTGGARAQFRVKCGQSLQLFNNLISRGDVYLLLSINKKIGLYLGWKLEGLVDAHGRTQNFVLEVNYYKLAQIGVFFFILNVDYCFFRPNTGNSTDWVIFVY